MTEPIWLSVDLVVDIHSEQLALFGGPDGIRDRGLLESALARPLNKFAYGDDDLASLAASYAFGIARNHPFVDGNKRVAFAAFLVFLGLNGVAFRVEPALATASMLALAAGEIDEAGFTQWVRDHL
ncbi:Death-on-curing protein [Beijerinckiaceae bacterium RH AL1]|nr:type II toxin-antitoxin system death-on-curing family toxin [Beijerinckiaceae bacterium]VVB45368.1 Death-on-curing protein [Beijerinckiaceae bacterium RH CH11]VVB45446.1 Death-on-curing protein [Beijerinckiaceae bacterium RH AL8]VVC54830.1 Death-on-curing protein [Beijerinckiaceae bacterium RH AL1]